MKETVRLLPSIFGEDWRVWNSRCVKQIHSSVDHLLATSGTTGSLEWFYNENKYNGNPIPTWNSFTNPLSSLPKNVTSVFPSISDGTSRFYFCWNSVFTQPTLSSPSCLHGYILLWAAYLLGPIQRENDLHIIRSNHQPVRTFFWCHVPWFLRIVSLVNSAFLAGCALCSSIWYRLGFKTSELWPFVSREFHAAFSQLSRSGERRTALVSGCTFYSSELPQLIFVIDQFLPV